MEEILRVTKYIHLVGIGGVGMSGLALLLKDKGFTVSGSDISMSPYTKILEEAGIKVFIGHRREQVSSKVQILGYSSAVSDDNPEILQAKVYGVDILKRGQLLAELCKGKKTIAVAGSHGKTTTSSLLGHILTSLGHKPTVFVGGLPLNYSKGAWWGEDYFVAETDESDGSFLYFNPWVSVITNIDNEHLDYYKTTESLENSFLEFAGNTSEKVIGWGDQPKVSQIIRETSGLSFGWGKNNFIRGENFKFKNQQSFFDLYIEKDFITSIETPLIGEYNSLNILAALAFFHYIGEDLKKVNQAITSFKGTKRRFEIKEKIKGVTFVDDYAHHPTEIRAVLAAARLLKPKRLFVVLQPHRFSRVKLLYNEFLESLKLADKVIITDIYSAHENNAQYINSKIFAETINKGALTKMEYVPKDEIVENIPAYLKEGDLVLSLGAGDINILMAKTREKFKKNG